MVPAWTSSSQVAWWTGRSHRFPRPPPRRSARRGQAGLGEVQAQLDDPLVQSRVGVPQVLEHLEVEGTQVVKAVHLDPDSLHVPQPGGEGLLHRAAVADLDLIPRYDLRLTGVLIGHGEVPQGEGIDVVLPPSAAASISWSSWTSTTRQVATADPGRGRPGASRFLWA